MWNIETEKMCNQHLLGEHVEMHMFVGCLSKNKSIQGYLDKKLIEVHNIEKRHSELVEEMKKRGFNHKSKLPGYKKIKLGKIDVRANKIDLRNRCKECRKMLGGAN
jgi:ribosomal protein L44E